MLAVRLPISYYYYSNLPAMIVTGNFKNTNRPTYMGYCTEAEA